MRREPDHCLLSRARSVRDKRGNGLSTVPLGCLEPSRIHQKEKAMFNNFRVIFLSLALVFAWTNSYAVPINVGTIKIDKYTFGIKQL